MKAPNITLFALLLGVSGSARAAQDLMQIYELAVQSDPKVKQFENNLLAVGETDNQAIAKLLPVVSITASSDWNRQDNKKSSATSQNTQSAFNPSQITQGSGAQEYWSHVATFSITQPVFHWDYWVQLSQADNQIAQAEADYQSEVQDLMFRVTDAYFNVLSAQDFLTFTKAEKEAYAKELEKAEERFEAGVAPVTDVYQARSSYDKGVADEISAANDLEDQKEKLREIIGESEVDLLAAETEFPLEMPMPADIEIWSKMADAQNFSIISELNAVEIARKDIEVQRSGHYPKLDASASVSQIDNNSSFGLRGDTENVGLTLTVPLFSGGSVYSKTRQAEYQYEQAKEKLTEIRRTTNRDVKDAYRDVITYISSVNAYKTAVLSSEKSLEATKAGYEVGTETKVDVLNVTKE